MFTTDKIAFITRSVLSVTTDEEKEINKVESSILSDDDSSSFKDVFVRHIATCDEDKAHGRFEGEVNTSFRFSSTQVKKSF